VKEKFSLTRLCKKGHRRTYPKSLFRRFLFTKSGAAAARISASKHLEIGI
jgi:hypothetical protein